MELHSDAPIIQRLGGPSAVARVFKIRPQAVSQWKWDGIPPARRMYLELARPDAFRADGAVAAARALADGVA